MFFFVDIFIWQHFLESSFIKIAEIASWNIFSNTLKIISIPLVPSSITELESLVDKLKKEVEQLREQKNQQKQLADSNARQRDMYKALLTQSTGFSLPPQGDNNMLIWDFCGELRWARGSRHIFMFVFRSRCFSPPCSWSSLSPSHSLNSSESGSCRIGTDCSDKSSSETGTGKHI